MGYYKNTVQRICVMVCVCSTGRQSELLEDPLVVITIRIPKARHTVEPL